MAAPATNVLARHLVQDDPEQGQAAAELIDGLSEDDPGFICPEVVIRLVRVLERARKVLGTLPAGHTG